MFEFDEKIYMIPETNQANQLRLYEAVSFPDNWKLKKVLLDICCVDTSIYCDTLNIYLETRDQILGKKRLFKFNKDLVLYEIETENNVFVDRRPGGSSIIYDTGIYHALQNCDGSYGKWLHIAKGLFDCIHTFNRLKNFEVIDLHLYQFQFGIRCRNKSK